MTRGRSAVAAAALWFVVAATGCGLGPGESSSGEATLTVTHDYGSVSVLEATEQDPAASETVIRFLDREAEITTRYAGGFVQSINGVSGEIADGRSTDWFFFVNGIESPRGGADVSVRGGDRIWWDYRDWTDAMRAPAVVGSWPEPFLQASTAAGDRIQVRIECFGARPPCDEVAARLSGEGVAATVAEPVSGGAPGEALRVLVGPWDRLRADPIAVALEDAPATSGVFARFQSEGDRWDLLALDQHAEQADLLERGAGLVAGLRQGEEPATWVVTGTDTAGVESAVAVLESDQLATHYAVVADGRASIPVPEQVPR
jgi:hypothetical protein